MNAEFPPAFQRALHRRPQYLGRLIEVRAKAKALAGYIPQTFPHYTQHTVEHSDEIVRQISQLLFEHGKNGCVVRALSATECYLLAVSAYVHDLGMAVSDAQKLLVLQSSEWRNWTELEPQASSLVEIENIRNGGAAFSGLHPEIRDFLADHRFRQLLAEYLRRTHHMRGASMAYDLENDLGGFSFGNHQIKQAVAAICEGHGLGADELEDDAKYPMDSDINGEPVNLRFLAILLRLGDLFDLRYDRACPLLLNAAAPLPIGSFPHWSQFTCITDLTTRPSRVRLRATCDSIEEHRVISDWCGWIEAELQNARKSVQRFRRHKEWQPPIFDYQIRSAPSARYIWRQWKLQIDEKLVLDRLIFDAYPTKLTFARELLQNALDANRCHLNKKLPASASSKIKKYPNLVAANQRKSFPVSITIRTVVFTEPNSGVRRSKTVFTIADTGIGMSRQVIEDYFLQVGRSWYQSDHFKRSFECSVTSQFGIGFLSVFAVSDHVVVDTLPYDGADEGTRMTLTGPRNYILTERTTRSSPGTTIEVELREAITADNLYEYILSQCTDVEFPVEIRHGSKMRRIGGAPKTSANTKSYSLPGEKILRVKSIPIESEGMFGNISFYVIASAKGSESWCPGYYFSDRFIQENPGWMVPPSLKRQKSYHGLLLADESYQRKLIGWRVDCRRKLKNLTLSRSGSGATRTDNEIESVIRATLESAIKAHLAACDFPDMEARWIYTCRLLCTFDESDCSEHRIIKGFVGNKETYIHGRDLARFVVIAHAADLKPYVHLSRVHQKETDYTECLAQTAHLRGEELTIKLSDLYRLPDRTIKQHFSKAAALQFEVNWPWVCIAFDAKKEATIHTTDDYENYVFINFPDDNVVGFTLDFRAGHRYNRIFLNQRNAFVRWLAKLWPKKVSSAKIARQFNILIGLVKSAVQFFGFPNEDLNSYVERFAKANQTKTIAPPPMSPDWCRVMDMASRVRSGGPADDDMGRTSEARDARLSAL